MIKSFIFENFKSFEKAELSLEAITSLIGTNSSGKSNAIEGIQILAESAAGLELSVILDGTRNHNSHVRGGSKACCRFRTQSFKLGCLVDLDDGYDLLYYIKTGVNGRVRVEEEALYKVKNGRTVLTGAEKIFKSKNIPGKNENICAEVNDGKKNGDQRILCLSSASVLSQLKTKFPQNTQRERECLKYMNLVLDNLKGIFVLNPVPVEMRDYVRVTDTELRENCENISSVLYHLCADEGKKEELLKIINHLPENEVVGIEFIRTQLDDVIFALREKYRNSSELVDAKRLSDGTLRCVAIVAAMLSMPADSVLIIEEIDNGIHPGRVQVLLESLSEMGKERKVDLILTTHNPVLVNKFDKDKLMGVSVVYRDRENGSSKFIPLVDIRDLPSLFAQGSLGDAMADDSLIQMIKKPKDTTDYSWLEV